jgi:AcrR family transcriptional regulator
MSPEQRREMIVRATIPLVIEHGSGVTTRRIAQAVGIGEDPRDQVCAMSTKRE